MLDHEMERVGRIVASDQGLEVRVQGTQAFAEPGRIVVPAIEKFDWLGKDAKRMLYGLLDHECAHAIYTDFPLFAASRHNDLEVARRAGLDVERILRLPPEALGNVLNAFEDIRIEARMGERYPGAARNLRMKNQWFFERRKQELEEPKDAFGAVLVALSLVGRGTMTMEQLKELNTDVHAVLSNALDLIDQSADAGSTADAFSLSIEFLERLQDDEEDDQEEGDGEEDEEEQDDEEDDQDEDGEGDNQEEDGEGDNQEEESDEEDGEEDDEEGSEPPSEGESNEEDPDPSEQDQEPERAPQSPGSASEEEPGSEELSADFASQLDLDEWSPEQPLDPEGEINGMVAQAMGEQDYVVFSHEFDYEKRLDTPEKLETFTPVWEGYRAQVETAASALMQAFEAALKAKRERRPVYGSDEGEVDSMLLGEYAVGSASPDTIYQQYVAEDDDDVVAAIMVDSSGSMGHGRQGKPRYVQAVKAAIAFHEALSAVQIPHEVTGFTTFEATHCNRISWLDSEDRIQLQANAQRLRNDLARQVEKGVDIKQFARCYQIAWDDIEKREVPINVIPAYAIFKSFDTDDGRAISAIRPCYENLDGEAVLWQARRLAQRPEKRRVMFVLSDGIPRGARHGVNQRGYLRDAVNRAMEAGIEVYGIGIATESVRQFYPRYWVAYDETHLAEVAMTSMIDVLTEARQERLCVAL